jgi:uncharacterized membrane protein YhaH (DUF805 family)
MFKTKTFILLLICQLLLINQGFAQNANPDFMQSIGKIYVVVAVIITIFIGIILFLISLERKIKRLEDQLGNE